MNIRVEGSFQQTGLSLFKNLRKNEDHWTEEAQMEYLQARMEELAMKEAEVNENGVVTIANEKPQSEVQESINKPTMSKKRGKKNDSTQAQLTKFFKVTNK